MLWWRSSKDRRTERKLLGFSWNSDHNNIDFSCGARTHYIITSSRIFRGQKTQVAVFLENVQSEVSVTLELWQNNYLLSSASCTWNEDGLNFMNLDVNNTSLFSISNTLIGILQFEVAANDMISGPSWCKCWKSDYISQRDQCWSYSNFYCLKNCWTGPEIEFCLLSNGQSCLHARSNR